jgi:hypothetical protein
VSGHDGVRPIMERRIGRGQRWPVDIRQGSREMGRDEIG